MIRINLLPQKQKGRRGFSIGAGDGSKNLWQAIAIGAVVLEIIVLLVVYKVKQDQLTQVLKANAEISSNIDSIKSETAKHADVKNELKDLREREDAIAKLQSARSGPTATMLELSRVLTTGRGPTVDRNKVEQLRREKPGSLPNASWDPRRLWLTSYKEADRVVKLGGFARDGEDVSEFLRRLLLSDYFYEVKMLPASKSVDGVTKLEVVKFEISAKVRY